MHVKRRPLRHGFKKEKEKRKKKKKEFGLD